MPLQHVDGAISVDVAVCEIEPVHQSQLCLNSAADAAVELRYCDSNMIKQLCATLQPNAGE
jgi:hypothetical protein